MLRCRAKSRLALKRSGERAAELREARDGLERARKIRVGDVAALRLQAAVYEELKRPDDARRLLVEVEADEAKRAQVGRRAGTRR